MSIRSCVFHLCYSHFRDRETEARVKELAQSLAWLVSGRARMETQISWTPRYKASPLWEGMGGRGEGAGTGVVWEAAGGSDTLGWLGWAGDRKR